MNNIALEYLVVPNQITISFLPRSYQLLSAYKGGQTLIGLRSLSNYQHDALILFFPWTKPFFRNKMLHPIYPWVLLQYQKTTNHQMHIQMHIQIRDYQTP